ncbi:MAG: hypothetical protein IM537_05905 [Pseudanabaena sp. M57BS1SP1A06MG]|nr:hypothetical protein [Pseudanabaena sp. M34BS1SP1A06MG]MCA6590659.1 hypothetical protein [Pseudanabaena sp. M38BS1SP1A06MG]MCA6599743.1 hypothetical protein [Pseudanabaena sp. M57BS1SP1A06MG]
MSEIIAMPKFYSNREVAQILGLKPASIRVIKQRHAEELHGLWQNNNPDGETVWSQEGLEKLAELSQTEEAKNFRAGALARRTQEAIAIDRASDQTKVANYTPQAEPPRTGQETTSYTISQGRYSGIENKIGGAIVDRMVDDGALERIDKAVVSGLLSKLNMGDDLDINALLG